MIKHIWKRANNKINKIPTNYLIFALALVICVVLSATYLIPFKKQGVEEEREKINFKYNLNIPKDAQNLLTDDNALYSYVQKYGLKQTAIQLNTLPGDCHQAAHRAGRFGYSLVGIEAFRVSRSECHSGEYHGAIEAFFKEHGTANLQKNLRTLCNSELNKFFSHQCIHGIGHGLMAWTNYDLPEALKSCDLLSQRQESCYSGVFMENVVGGLDPDEGHNSKYLNNDPQYPCDIVDAKYKSACYFFQTSRMMQLFNADFQKISETCANVPEDYKNLCYSSMGRDAHGAYQNDLASSISACNFADYGEFRTQCLDGAVQDAFWDPTGADKAIEFCKSLNDNQEKASCYDTIIERAPDVIFDKKEYNKFCKKLEPDYINGCYTYFGN